MREQATGILRVGDRDGLQPCPQVLAEECADVEGWIADSAELPVDQQQPGPAIATTATHSYEVVPADVPVDDSICRPAREKLVEVRAQLLLTLDNARELDRGLAQREHHL